MPDPYFYFAPLAKQVDEFVLDENSSRHIVQVLRMKPGETLRLTDGNGLSAQAVIREAIKKRCIVNITEKHIQPAPARKVLIALSLLKNATRFEWFLEKASELGITEIIPLKCARTEKQQFRMDRMRSILESALIQSQQVWMPKLHEPQSFRPWIEQADADQKFIAHCDTGAKTKLSEIVDYKSFSPAYPDWTGRRFYGRRNQVRRSQARFYRGRTGRKPPALGNRCRSGGGGFEVSLTTGTLLCELYSSVSTLLKFSIFTV